MNNPISTLRLQYATLALVAVFLVCIVAGVGYAVVTEFHGWVLPLTVATMALGMGCLIVGLGVQALANVRNYRAHVISRDAHVCQCPACSADLTPTRNWSGHYTPTVPTPRERELAGNVLLRSGLAMVAVCLLGLLASSILLATSGPGTVSETLLPMSRVLMVVLAFMGIVVALAGWAVRRNASRVLAAGNTPHDCICRWCGTSGQPRRH